MFQQISRNTCDANGDDTIVIKWCGTNQYQTIMAVDLRDLQARFNEFVSDVTVCGCCT